MHSRLRFALTCCLIAGCAGCDGAPGEPPDDAGAHDGGGSHGLSVTIEPRAATLPVRGQRAFACEVTGASDTGCTFAVEEVDGGSVSPAGIYEAPAVAGTYHVIATSNADPTRSDRATVTVTAPASACDALPAPGTWENVTPKEVAAQLGAEHTVFAFVVDPVNAGTVYFGTIGLGIWRSTDCGASWVHVNTGRNGAVLDSAMNWTFLVDPEDPDVLYTNAGYGDGSNGMFRSENGGVDWDEIWPPADPELRAAFGHNFANTISMDPHDHEHLIVSFHEECLPPYNGVCIAETFDAGTTWELVEGDPSWTTTGEGVRAIFLEDGEHWLFSSQADGMWRTEDGGASWIRVTTQGANHLQSTQAYRATDGTFYVAGLGQLWRSPTGTSIGEWTAIADIEPLPGGIVGDGTTLYTSVCYYGDFCDPARAEVYYTSPETDGTSWTPMASPPIGTFRMGGILGLDRTHRVLYSTNMAGGFWRVVLD